MFRMLTYVVLACYLHLKCIR